MPESPRELEVRAFGGIEYRNLCWPVSRIASGAEQALRLDPGSAPGEHPPASTHGEHPRRVAPRPKSLRRPSGVPGTWHLAPSAYGVANMCDGIFSITGKSILLAGAGGGLGGTLARALSARGARLTLSDMSAAPIVGLARDLGEGVVARAADITAEEEVDALIAHACQQFGRIDALVNAAGMLRISPALKLDVATFREALEVNLTGAFLLSRAAARAMPAGGRIVHLASVSSVVANPDYAAYAAPKAALSQLVRVLAREWAARNITVNAIGPAMAQTGMTEGYLANPAFRQQALAAIPLGRFATPEDLIGALILLLSPAGAFITGQTIHVDGGRTLV